jgi:hypothetical protein
MMKGEAKTLVISEASKKGAGGRKVTLSKDEATLRNIQLFTV